MTISTASTYTAMVNNQVMDGFLREADQFCPYFVGAQEGDGVLDLNGNSFTGKWRRYGQLSPTTTALTALTGTESYPFREGTTVSVTDVTATVQKYGQVFALNEEVELLNATQQSMELAKRLGESAGRSLNRLQRNELEDNSTLVYVGGATTDGTTGNVLTLQSVRSVLNTLARGSARKFRAQSSGSTVVGSSPIRPAFWGITHVDCEYDIRDMAGFIAAESYASHTEVVNGEFGMVEGCRFIMTEEASQDADLGADPGGTLKSTSGTNADLYTTVIFGQDYHGHLGLGREHVKETYNASDPIPAVELINHARGSGGVMDPLNELRTMAWKSWHAPKILNAAWGRGIRHGASDLAA